MRNNNFKSFVKLSAVSVVAIVSLFAFSNGAEVANVLLVIINLAVVLVALDRVIDLAILDTQSKLLTPPALTLL